MDVNVDGDERVDIHHCPQGRQNISIIIDVCCAIDSIAMNDAITVKKVNKTFGATRAVSDLDLVVPRGALYGFIGPNGAGKTTTIRMMMSILFPGAGELSVVGRRGGLDAKNRIGCLPEERGVYRKMRVGPFLTFMARLKGVPEADIAHRVRQGLSRVGLEDTERKRCEDLSKGMQ